MLNCYIQSVKPDIDEFTLPTFNIYLCVYDELMLKVWQSENELGSLIRYSPITWYPVGWQN